MITLYRFFDEVTGKHLVDYQRTDQAVVIELGPKGRAKKLDMTNAELGQIADDMRNAGMVPRPEMVWGEADG
jgi:hypothetical protein